MFKQIITYKNPADLERLLDAWRKAAQADESGAALAQAISRSIALPQAAE